LASYFLKRSEFPHGASTTGAILYALAIKTLTFQALSLNSLPRRAFSRPSSQEQLPAGLGDGCQPFSPLYPYFLLQ